MVTDASRCRGAAVCFTLLFALSCGGDAAQPADSGGLVNVLKWTTTWEQDNAGFDVYRAPSSDGPFERLTAERLPGAGSTHDKREYRYEDRTIEAGREYFYVVEAVKTTGERVKITGVMRAAAKELAPP